MDFYNLIYQSKCGRMIATSGDNGFIILWHNILKTDKHFGGDEVTPAISENVLRGHNNMVNINIKTMFSQCATGNYYLYYPSFMYTVILTYKHKFDFL